MSKKKTLSEFISEARNIHGDKYDYSKVDYKDNHTGIIIICPVHGEFEQTPKSHLRGQGCPHCAGVAKMNNETFIKKAREVHGDKYDYSKVDYKGNKKEVIIICPVHGEFKQKPNAHLNGHGCPKCSHNQKSDSNEFVKKAKKIHGDKYIYDKVEYVNNKVKVCITCPIHGDFWQKPNSHLGGCGCPKCGGKQKITTEEFIEKAKSVHKDKYDYSRVNYINAEKKVEIICPIHGSFWQKPSGHLNGYGCPKCGGHSRLTTKDFCEKAKTIHTNNNYVYDYVDYKNYDTPIKIVCPIHGEFWQTPDAHLQGSGCPKCGNNLSKGEDEINNFINIECHIQTIAKDKSLLDGKLECDIVVPSCKLAIEFNGLRWHSEQFNKDKNYHLNKTELAKSKGYHLIHIFEDEWIEHKDIVLNKIRHFLGKDLDKPVVGARKCTVKTVSKTLAEPFLTTYHVQGFVPSTAYYGAFYGDILVGVMTFKQEKPNMWNLTRFATNTDYRLPGLANKIFKQFIKDNNPIEVKTFLDRRWSHCNENVYDRMGFKLVETLPPDYRYVIKNQRIHKFNFRKQILSKKYNLPLDMTEKEMTEQLGFYRIWDCGLYKYVWNSPTQM